MTWGTEDYRLLFGQTMEVMTVATFYSFFFLFENVGAWMEIKRWEESDEDGDELEGLGYHY